MGYERDGLYYCRHCVCSDATGDGHLCCKTCSFERIFKGLAFLLLGMLCIALNYYAVKLVRDDKQSNHNSIRDLLTSLVSSVIIAIYGYIMKKLLYRKKEGVSMEGNEGFQTFQQLQSPSSVNDKIQHSYSLYKS